MSSVVVLTTTFAAVALSAGDVGVTVVGQRAAVSLQANPAAPALRPRAPHAVIAHPAHAIPPLLHPVEAVSPTFLACFIDLIRQLSAPIMTHYNTSADSYYAFLPTLVLGP